MSNMSQDESGFQRETIVGRPQRVGNKVWLLGIANTLDDSARLGANTDVPEGSRWIQLSDTLASQIAEGLRAIARRRDRARLEPSEFKDDARAKV